MTHRVGSPPKLIGNQLFFWIFAGLTIAAVTCCIGVVVLGGTLLFAFRSSGQGEEGEEREVERAAAHAPEVVNRREVSRKDWDFTAPVTKLTEAVTCFELNLGEWSEAFEAPVASRVNLKSPTPAVEWWFSDGTVINGNDIQFFPGSTGEILKRLPTRTFRVRDIGASGKAVIFIYN